MAAAAKCINKSKTKETMQEANSLYVALEDLEEKESSKSKQINLITEEILKEKNLLLQKSAKRLKVV